MDTCEKPRARCLREDLVEGMRECWVVTSKRGTGYGNSLRSAYFYWASVCKDYDEISGRVMIAGDAAGVWK